MKQHRHTVHTTSDALPFFGPVSATRQNRAAHGGCRFREQCKCGAVREVLVNGRHEEVGAWQVEAQS